MAGRLSDDSTKKMTVPDDKDRFEDLPEDVLQLLMSFLPSRDAVRTSVLARRWRNLWKSLPSLRITHEDGQGCENVQAYKQFVSKLLEFRDRMAPLDLCVIYPYPDGDQSEARQDVESWVHYAISRKVSVLRIENSFSSQGHMQLSSRTVISKHLTTLQLNSLEFDEHPLDLLSCQALEVLEIHGCYIILGDIFPKSLRHLKIKYSTLVSTHTPWARISAPGLVTFELANCLQWTPLLESLPSLVTAYIRIDHASEDSCDHEDFGDCGNESCDRCYGEVDCSVLLEGLSGATNLQLITEGSMIFRKDLKWCPMFSKLKTVLLNEWCVGANFKGLVYFLQHSPILERLTLQVSHYKYSDNEAGESYNPKEHFLVSEHLKIISICCCPKEEKMICQILKILGTHGVNPAQIHMKHDLKFSDLFSFEQKLFSSRS